MAEAKSPEPSKGGYGKRSMKQWIVIYVVVAIVVYALIYFLFIRGNSSSGY
jgi:hypothetical protein